MYLTKEEKRLKDSHYMVHEIIKEYLPQFIIFDKEILITKEELCLFSKNKGIDKDLLNEFISSGELTWWYPSRYSLCAINIQEVYDNDGNTKLRLTKSYTWS